MALEFVFSGLEVRKQCFDRAEYHTKRAEEKEAGLPELKRSMELLVGNGQRVMATKSNYNFDADTPIEKLEEDIRDHKEKAHRFTVFAHHLPEDSYSLSLEEMRLFEFIKGR
jgi:hypothetical protein